MNKDVCVTNSLVKYLYEYLDYIVFKYYLVFL